MSLPSRAECEVWGPDEVAKLMRQKQMQECADVVNRFRMDGMRLLNLSHSDLSKFSLIHQPQLQKIIQDINKNDGSILNKLRRLRKSIPKVPERDYSGDDFSEAERWSEADDTYEDPQEEAEHSYEPPPSHRVFRSTPSSAALRGDYVDSFRKRPNHLPRKPERLPNKASQPLPPKPQQLASEEGDYIEPEGGNDDNYIEATEKPPSDGDFGEAERWSEADDTYEDPQEELPPSHRVFRSTPSSAALRRDYIDSFRKRPNHLPRKPERRPNKASQPLPPEPQQLASEEGDYIEPEGGNDDNYIEATEKLPSGDDLGEAERWSEADESATYEDPREEAEHSYEPLPSHRVFRSTPSSAALRRDYVDSFRKRPNHLPRKPERLPNKASQPLPPEPQQLASEEGDYIEPEGGNDDNYIEPTEKPPSGHFIHGSSTRAESSFPAMANLLPDLPDLYEMSCQEDNNPPASRFDSTSLPPRVIPRLNRIKPDLFLEPSEDSEYEVCDPDNNASLKTRKDPPPLESEPLPREKPPKPVIPTKPLFKHKELKGQSLPPPVKAFAAHFRRPKIALPQIFTRQSQADLGLAAESGLTVTDKKADVNRQPWYSCTCDRKTAEEALTQSNRDGSYLVRNSSGQNAQQPYTLAVLYSSKVYNIPVRFIEATQQYALGREKTGEEYFSSVSRIIENHQRNPLVLIDKQNNTKDTTQLRHAVRPGEDGL